MIERNDYVRVTSTKEAITARYNGQDYEFRPSEHVDLHQVVAAHIFGFGCEDKAPALARLGWAQSSDQLKAALERLRHVRFTTAPPLIDGPMPEVIDASAGDRMPNRTPSGAPIAGGGEADAVPHVAASAEPRGKAHAR